MKADLSPATNARKSLSPAQAVGLGTLTVGIADLLDAFLFFGLRGVAPIRILQSIASGIFGREAFSGGIPMAVLGVCLHFFIAFAIVSTYFLASRKFPVLHRYPLVSGLLYGVLVYLFMTFVTVPLSAAASGIPSLPVAINGLLIHMLGVGLPAALFARAVPPHSQAPA